MRPPFLLERTTARWRWVLADILEARATLSLALLLVLVYLPLWLLTIPEIFRALYGVVPHAPFPGTIGAAQEDLIDTIYLHGGLTRDAMLSGQIWQIFTHGLLHANLIHLLFNLGALIMAGFQAERIIGSRGLLKLFLGGVVSGGLGHLLLQPSALANTPLVGASGGIAAIFFWLITLSPEARSRFLPFSWKTLGRVLLGAQFVAVAWLWLPHVNPVSGNGNAIHIVGHACHLGGSLYGWWTARRLLRPAMTREQMMERRARREARDAERSSRS